LLRYGLNRKQFVDVISLVVFVAALPLGVLSAISSEVVCAGPPRCHSVVSGISVLGQKYNALTFTVFHTTW